MKPLTPTQQQVMAYVRAYFAENDQLPPARQMAKHFGWSSATSAVLHYQRLIKAGVLERNEAGGWRFVRATKEKGASPA